MELQQSSVYAEYISSLKWKIIMADGIRMFYKKIPFLGGLLKIQRPATLPNVTKLIRELHIATVAIEPTQNQDIRKYKAWVKKLSTHCRVVRSVYLPTKTILVDLKPKEEIIFQRFSEAKRRAVRKATKNGVIVTESQDIKNLIRIKNKSGGFLGFITTIGTDTFWNIMAPKHATILLAHRNNKLVAGVLLVFWNKTAHYWIAGATHEGKKFFAPTLLVWEALRLSKKRGAKLFDFLGVWDERKPSEHNDWKGFTRFKEGFGGVVCYYPVY